MIIGSAHCEYTAHLVEWSRARDVLAGEDAVKAAGPKYLPRLDSQSDEEYGAYKARASFLGATSRTLEEYLDLVFRRAPVSNLEGCGKGLQAFMADCDLWGMDFPRYARRVLGEVLSVGRAGSLVLAGADAGRPWVSSWLAEDREAAGAAGCTHVGGSTGRRRPGPAGATLRAWKHCRQCE